LTARRHHYISQAYLAGFTHDGRKNGKFYVLDINDGRVFRTSPKNVAVVGDFNRIDVDGLSPDALEQALSPFEDKAVSAIRRVLSTRACPTGDDLNLLINFLCLLSTRNPRFRDLYNGMRIRGAENIMGTLLSDEEVFELAMGKALAAGEVTSTVSFEEMKTFVEEKNYRLEVPTSLNVSVECELFDFLLPKLGTRYWSILIAPENSHGFLCCDHPVVLVFKDIVGNQRIPIGFGVRETEIYFPFSSRICFYGVFEDPPIPNVILKKKNVETINSYILSYARRYVYSKKRITERALERKLFSFQEMSIDASPSLAHLYGPNPDES